MNMHQIINIALSLFAAGVSIPVGIKLNRELRAERKRDAAEDAAVEAADAEAEEDHGAVDLAREAEEAKATHPAVNVVVPTNVTIH